MTLIVLDTDVWSYLYKADTRAEAYRPFLLDKEVGISFQTMAELYQWAALNTWGEQRRKDLDIALSSFTVLQPSRATCLVWARVRASRSRAGKPIAPQDAWIAACAIEHGAALLTHNSEDYALLPELELVSV